jgi:hypothetical protein
MPPRHAPYIRQRPDGWYGADHQNGPWRPIPAPQSGLPWKTDGPAVPESGEPASVATEASPLSPAVQGIDDAARDAWHSQMDNPRAIAAAALRAATDHGEYLVDPEDERIAVVRVSDLEAWAAGLEGING